MKELLDTISKWTKKNKTFAIARVIKTWGSSPRPIGSTMIISEDLEMAGSVSGGCVEGAVVKASNEVIKNGGGKMLSFGVTDDEAWEVGLSCGGKIDVYLEKYNSNQNNKTERQIWNRLIESLSENEPCILLTYLSDRQNHHFLFFPNGKWIGEQSNEVLLNDVLRIYNERKNQVIEHDSNEYFVQIFPRRSQILIIGAAHITVDLVTLAKMYDFETIVIDPRGIFTNNTQFTTPPDQIFEKYPEEVLLDFSLDAYTYAVVLSHDPKIDDNALSILLKSDVAYIGALGSRRTHAKRIARLEAAGFPEQSIKKIHAPIGVDINAKKPKEIAMSIMGEIIKTQNDFL